MSFLENLRKAGEKKDAMREKEAKGRQLNRLEDVASRRRKGEITHEAAQVRVKEAKTIYEKERKSPTQRIYEKITNKQQKPEREKPEKKEGTPTYRPAASYKKEPRETRRKEPRETRRGGRAESRRQNAMPQAPSFRMSDFLPSMGSGYSASPISIMPPVSELPFTGGFGSAPRSPPRKKGKRRRQSQGINFGFTNPNYIPPGLKKFF